MSEPIEEIIKFACDAIAHYQEQIERAIELDVITEDSFLQGQQYKKIIPEIMNQFADWQLETKSGEKMEKSGTNQLTPAKIVPPRF